MTNSTKYHELQRSHLDLLKKYEASDIPGELTDEIQNYIKQIREEAELVSDPQDREQLRANLNFWASTIYELTGTYPNTTLFPYNDLKIEIAKVEQAISAQEALKGILPNDLLETGLLPLRQKQAELQAKLSGRGPVMQGERSSGTSGGKIVATGDVIVGDIITGHKYISITGYDDTQLIQAKHRYLRTLIRLYNTLPIVSLGGVDSTDNEVRLENIYVALDTTTKIPFNSNVKEKVDQLGLENRSLSVIEVAAQNKRLVILGNPGSGKSTFVRLLSSALASAFLENRPLSENWELGLCPVLMNLRDLGPYLAALNLRNLSPREQNLRLAQIFETQWQNDLRALGAAELANDLLNSIVKGGVVLIFDGLDEITEELRSYAIQGIYAIIEAYPAVERILITSRIRSYTGRSILHGFPTCTLEPFDSDKIRAFITAWYRSQADLGRLSPAWAELRARNLEQAIHSSSLRELASNPMLLTTIVLLHQAEGALPLERVRLYSRATDILLMRWQRYKGGAVATSPALDEVLRNSSKLHQIMDRLGYEAHLQQGKQEQGVYLDRFKILALLEQESYLGDIGLAAEFLDYIEYRTGLLVGRGGSDGRSQTYSFIHRTFQEYLAGRYLISGRRISRMYWQHLEQGEHWQLAAQLGVEELFYNQRRVVELLDLAYDLCSVREPQNEASGRAILWSGQMAVIVGKSTIEEDREHPDGGIAYLNRLTLHLIHLLAGNHLPSTERVEAGRILAKLGDPRLGVGVSSNGLPDIKWCEVPAGPFSIGSDPARDPHTSHDELPMHQAVLSAFLISRYPITNIQFYSFVADGGYQSSRYWTAEAWELIQSQELHHQAEEIHKLQNHPVITVSWYEAMAFCRWLTDKLKAAGALTQHQIITLPSEIEWEKAARGVDARLYPWGDEFDAHRLNCLDTGIGTISAVGCFQSGVSPYGCEEMSGNVWEWTRSINKNYPYDPSDGREDLHVDGKILIVIRGGDFTSTKSEVRCATRFYSRPDTLINYVGFRVVLSVTSDI